jgi:predicted dehydrogenase
MSETATPVRVGLLGTGAIAQVVHLPILSQLKTATLQGVCDLDHAKARAIARRFGLPQLFQHDEDVFRADVDAVIICTPSHLHEAQAIAALEAGKHVLVEKPLALTAAGAERVLQAAQRAGRSLMVAMNSRYRPDAVALKPFLEGQELGDVFLVKAGWLNSRVRTVRSTWRHRRQTAGGGALMDLGVQILDLCLWLLDYPPIERVVAHLHPGEGMEVEDSAAVVLSTPGGMAISIEVTWSLVAARDRHYLHVLGTRGSASLPPLTVNKEVEHGLLDVTPQIAPPGKENLYTASYRQELTRFIEVCRGDQPAELPREQVQLMRLMAMAYQSAEDGREVMG